MITQMPKTTDSLNFTILIAPCVTLVNSITECFVTDGDPRMTFVTQNHTSKRPPLQKENNLNMFVSLFRENVAVMQKYTNKSVHLNAKLLM